MVLYGFYLARKKTKKTQPSESQDAVVAPNPLPREPKL